MVDFDNYDNRRMFSDAVHVNIADKVYQYLGRLIDDSRDDDYHEKADLIDGIDYYVLVNGHHRTVQERFRTSKNCNYNDITLRYQYPENKDDRSKSEWFKLTADYFMYGVINQNTNDSRKIKPSAKFLKLVVIDLRVFSRLVDNEKIIVGSEKFSKIIDGKLVGGLNSNVSRVHDNRSIFAVFDVKHLYQTNEDLIIVEKGYNTPKDIFQNTDQYRKI
ncbi:MAG: hypothetical protein L0L22_06215 [Staphylococcus equorum]|nr:hypothetical protein [Tetragenococcus koreensis]MDN6570578.1 hypothetical protein [Staphylococcus equorum]MDN6729542.1 hypothetical protein [Alkalibacterium sp.]MDN6749448.1 hypothetical protein [Staphylococcus equorum]